MSERENPASPRANAGNNRDIQSNQERPPHITTHCDGPDFAAVYVAMRYRLPLPIAAVIARLAELGGALS